MRIAIIGLLTLIVTTGAEAADSGLEVPHGTKAYVLVGGMSEKAKEIGLTRELITSKVELQLRRNGIAVGTEADVLISNIYLYLNVMVIGKAFSCIMMFQREVFYWVGNDIHSIIGTTYHHGVIGTHGSKGQDVIEGVINLVDIFSNDFLKANQTKNKSDAGGSK